MMILHSQLHINNFSIYLVYNFAILIINYIIMKSQNLKNYTEPTIKIGMGYFQQEVKSIYLPQNMINVLQSQIWFVQSHAFNNYWKHLLKNLISTKIIGFAFTSLIKTPYLQSDQIFYKSICNVNFSKLKILNLSFNKLDNVEFLSLMDVSKLKHLVLNTNSITNLNCLKKMKLDAGLEGINLDQNKVQIFDISKLRLAKRPRQKKIFSFTNKHNNQIVIQDISFFIKAECQKIYLFQRRVKRNIKQDRIVEIIQKKHGKKNIVVNQVQEYEIQMPMNNFLPPLPMLQTNAQINITIN